jgi:hypothetical protein
MTESSVIASHRAARHRGDLAGVDLASGAEYAMKLHEAPRFVVLLVLIIAELMVTPLLAGTEFGLHAAQLLTGLVMIAALWAAGAQLAPVVLFVPTVAAHVVAAYSDTPSTHVVALLFRVAFFGYATGLIAWRMMRHSEVTVDTIAAAACVYTLFALIWAGLYGLLEFFHPGSFLIPAVWRISGDPQAALVYFSFVTLTTVGYGDITPQWPGAGGLAASEALVGQLYLAITIARLVGMHASKRR